MSNTNSFEATFGGDGWSPRTLSLQQELGTMGVTRFVPVNYKNDWANIRRIDQSIDRARADR